MIKVVLFDVDDTILDFTKCSRQALIDACKLFNLNYSELLFNTFATENAKLWQRLERGEIVRKYIFQNRWNIIFSKLQIEGIDGVEFEAVFHGGIDTQAIAVDHAYELLDYLKSKYVLCVASNAKYKQQIGRLTQASMINYFDQIFISEEMGAVKPSDEFYNEMFKRLGNIKHDEIIMIGDSVTADIIGSKKHGLKTILFNHDHAYDKNLYADYFVNDLLEIKNIL